MQINSNDVNAIIKKTVSAIGCVMLLTIASQAQHLSGRSPAQNYGLKTNMSAAAKCNLSPSVALPGIERSSFKDIFVSNRGDCTWNYEGPPLSVAFSSNRDGNDEIYVMDPDGKGQVNFSQHPASELTPDISPDGRYIAFASNRTTAENPEGDYEIFVMEFGIPGSVRQVTRNNALDGWPRWSPNSETIAFETRETAAATSWEIYRYTLGGGNPVRLTMNNMLDRFPEWSPRGEVLVIRRLNDLHLIGADGSDIAQLTYDVPAVGSGFPAAPGIDQMASFSPDGKMLTWMSARNGYPSVFIMDIGQPEIQIELTPRPSPAPAVFVSRAPGWSADGHHIYFTRASPETGNEEDIYVMNADGTCVNRLTETLGRNMESAVR